MSTQHTCGQCEHYQVRGIYVIGHYERDGKHYNQKVSGSKWVSGHVAMRTKEETDEGICTADVPLWVWFNTPLVANEVMYSTTAICRLFQLAEKSP